MKKSKKDLHRAFIIAAIREKGSTLTQLSIDAGLHPRTLGNALDRKYPKGEKIIADFLGVSPQKIWPSRYYPFKDDLNGLIFSENRLLNKPFPKLNGYIFQIS